MSLSIPRTILVTFWLVAWLNSIVSSTPQACAEDTYRMVSADGTAKIPFEIFRGDILLRAVVNAEELRLALDNGVLWDELLLYGGPKIDALGLTYAGQAQLGKEGDLTATSANTATGITVLFPGIELKNQSALVTPADSRMSRMFEGQNGIISGSLFKHFVVQIDFETMVITLMGPGKFESEGAGQALAMSPFGPGSYTLPCTLHLRGGKQVTVNPVLDLGPLQAAGQFGRVEPASGDAQHVVLDSVPQL